MLNYQRVQETIVFIPQKGRSLSRFSLQKSSLGSLDFLKHPVVPQQSGMAGWPRGESLVSCVKHPRLVLYINRQFVVNFPKKTNKKKQIRFGSG